MSRVGSGASASGQALVLAAAMLNTSAWSFPAQQQSPSTMEQSFELKAGGLFYIPPIAHDSWVIGDQAYVSLHFVGADQYAKDKASPGD